MLLAEIEELQIFCEFPFGLAEFRVEVVGPSLPAFVRSLRISFLRKHPIRYHPPIRPLLLTLLLLVILLPGQEVQILAFSGLPHAASLFYYRHNQKELEPE